MMAEHADNNLNNLVNNDEAKRPFRPGIEVKDKLEHVVSSSARDWCESEGKNLAHYKMVGVNFTSSARFAPEALTHFTREIPENAEVVTDFRSAASVSNATAQSTFGMYVYIMSGTALIPRYLDNDLNK
jgi:hypothetical protein